MPFTFKHNTTQNLIRIVAIVTVLSLVALPAYVFWFLYPSFVEYITEETEHETVSIANHIALELIPPKAEINKIFFPDERIKQYQKDFNIKKMRVFLPDGLLVYSTNPKEIGTRNKADYFQSVVAKGQVFSKVVKKNMPTYSGGLAATDIVETYVPIIREEKFIGAFEIYYDFKERKAGLDRLIAYSYTAVFAIICAILAVLFVLLQHARRIEKERSRMEEANKELGLEIQERRKLEAIITESKNDWEYTFNAIADAVTIHGADYSIIRANKAAEVMFKISPEVRSPKCYELLHNVACPVAGCLGAEAMRTSKPCQREIYEDRLNKFFEISAYPKFDNFGRIQGFVHIIRDITEFKNAQTKLIKAYMTTKEITDYAPFGIYVVASDGQIEYVNNAMLDISGTTEESFKSMNIFNLPSYSGTSLVENIQAGLNGESFKLENLKFTSYFGRKTTIRNFTGIPIDEGGNKKLLVIVEDITERSKLTAQLFQSQKMEVLGRLAGGVAHDFNNILTGISGYADLERNKLIGISRDTKYLDNIRELTDKAAKLTKNLLSFSRKKEIEMSVIDLLVVVTGFEKMIERIIGSDIKMKIHMPDSPINIMGDAGQIEQVLMNLATNARDAMPGGGLISITVDKVKLAESSSLKKNMANQNCVLITFSDSGTGIDKESAAQIFEPFFTTKEEGKGTGLGLSIVYGIVKQHNGVIDVYSEPGQGTTFKIYLPLTENSTKKETAGRVMLPVNGNGKTVLLADDDPHVRNVLRCALETASFNVIEAEDGDEAVHLFVRRQEEITIFLSDVMMPKKNGFEAHTEIKKINPKIKTMFISGYSPDLVKHKMIAEDNCRVLMKPVSPIDLLKHIGEML
ncbi:MAG: response regulator [Nitrospirae bacterium]|nr:response regulator [Nitrospirota bacterium]